MKKPVTVISYLTHKPEPMPAPAGGRPAPVFVFWGRLARQKNLPRAIALVGALQRRGVPARFVIIGPDGDDTQAIRAAAERHAEPGSVVFAGPMDFAGIRDTIRTEGACFYLQTSRYEGMALSVVEAMQLGLVPVVAPVGEIGHYCIDGTNAVVLAGDGADDDGAALVRIETLLRTPEDYRALSRAAVRAWHAKPLFSASVLSAAERLLQGPIDPVRSS